VRILLIGNDHVVAPLRELGHEVIVAMDEHPALAPGMGPFDVRALWDALPAAPDVALVIDTLGGQMLPYGFERLPVPRLYYAIDVHLNFFWQRHYAHLFDLVLVAQKDFVPLFEAEGVPARWLPWGANDAVFHDRGLPRIHDLAFVGIVDPATRPKRAAAVELLQRRFGMVTFGTSPATRLAWDEMARVLSSTRIVFNEAVLGDVNFRVFEAMACGAMLLTERVGNGLEDLFTVGEHLAVYTPETLVAQVEHYLAAADERARIAAGGMAEVHARHTLRARMAELTALVEREIPRRDVGARAGFHWGMAAHLAVVRGLAFPATTARPAAIQLRAAMDEEGEAEAAIALAAILEWAGQRAAALDVLAAARRLDPGNVRAWFLAAELERRAGRVREAAALLRGGVHAAPEVAAPTAARALAAIDGGIDTAASLHALGLVLQEVGLPFLAGFVPVVDAGLPRTAFDYFVRALAADPGHREAADSAAALLEWVNLPDFAPRFAALAVRAAPADGGARGTLARLLRKAYHPADAAHQERIGHALAGCMLDHGTRAERARAYHEAGLALRQAGAPERAALALDRAAACLPESVELVVDSVLARLPGGDWAGARARLEQALAAAGGEAEEVAQLLRLMREAESRAGTARPA
jgi:tetratricopeptide (TPR) repeat protein